jgi:hypothetical protein
MNNNFDTVDDILKARQTPPDISKDLPAKILRAALKEKSVPHGQKRYIWLFNPRSFMALAACFALIFVVIGGGAFNFNPPGTEQNTYERKEQTTLAAIDGSEIDVLYYWEDYDL